MIYLRSFIEVARCQSFTKAAETLGYVQSSVTAHIQKLESEYGVVLFERYGRSMRLTSAGKQLLDVFERITALYDDSKRLISRQATGTLEIGTIESLMAFFLPPVFRAFFECYPQVNLQVDSLVEANIYHAVEAGTIDIGIYIDRPIVSEELESIPIRQEPLVLVAQPGHRLGGTGALQIGQLQDEALIATEQGCTYRAAFERLLRQNGVSYRIQNEFGNLETIKQCVGYGLGIALLPRLAATRELREGRLIELEFTHPDLTFYTQIIHHKKKWLNPATRRLIQLLTGTDIPSKAQSTGG
ncbi:LysR family transcriptional regulator [Cohnella sp. GCM10027633]|uniref:LysR family transcriptional regulator n=1 Tax=unclassified Cohnella TaxID=2636738 RepID=UPI003644B08D